MEKIKVTNGVYWVEEPDVDLYVLCGCPADTVKHLIKRGLILKRRKRGVDFETGPNAILLSDVPIQKGNFANLSEFPVLQMFYKQGMLVPNHPNNTGRKPMLIGSKDQVEAQSKYIYRGNYGLTSVEEIMAAGVDERQAKEMMRLKLRFAFDHIQDTGELLDLRMLEKEGTELRDGVFLCHKAFNVYEFTYKGEKVEVDLNLKPGEEYEPAFYVGFHTVDREYFSVIHIGEGDGWDVNRPCMSSIVVFQGRIYLIDAGPNIQHSLTALGISVNEIDGVFHTHGHDDHFAGMTALVRANHMIKYYATPLVRASIIKKFSALTSIDEEEFGRYFDVHDLEFDEWNNINGLEVMPVFSPHPVETSIMHFRTLWDGGYKTYSHLADTVSFNVLESMVTADPDQSGVSREYFDRVKASYLIPADLKKIDIGGGMIHGMAEDFVDDKSDKIILCHVDRTLTDAEKETGSNATFGMQDVLIPARYDYCVESARRCLANYFPDIPASEIEMLLNSHIVDFNVGSIILKKGVVNEHIYLILNGVVEYIESEDGVNYIMSSASMIGELSGIMGRESRGTYRSASYVKALELPCDLYMEFAKRNNLYGVIKRIHNRREFLKRTWLFGEMVSYPIHNAMAHAMTKSAYSAGKRMPQQSERQLFLIEEGAAEVRFNRHVIERLRKGCFCAEESVLFDIMSFFEVFFTEDSVVYSIPHEELEGIPIVMWKLRETFDWRLKLYSNFIAYE